MDEQTKDELDDYLRGCVRIDPANINDEFVRLPSDYALWNERYRTALERSLLAEAEVKRVHAGLYLRGGARVMPTGKPATVDWIKAMIEDDPDYQQAVADAIRAEADVAHVKGVLEAIRTKREALVSIGANIRQEMQHDPAVRDRTRTERTYRGG